MRLHNTCISIQQFKMKSINGGWTPLVSIAIATYNGYAFIAEQLDSILAQTVSDFEVIIVDDCSTDNTRLLLQEYQQRDDRIHLYSNDANIGYRETFYRALEYCATNYILFCDQDDVWLPHKLETLLAAIDDNLLIFSDSALIDERGNQLGINLSNTVRMQQPGPIGINRGFVIGNCVWGHTILFHRDLLSYTNANRNEHPHDWWFAVVSSHLRKIKYCADVLNYYRQHSRNVTQAIPVKTGRVTGRKLAEFETQLSRLNSIAALSCNIDQAFYREWTRLFQGRRNGFSFPLFRFLLAHRKDIFSLKRKTTLAQVIEIRKMCRKID